MSKMTTNKSKKTNFTELMNKLNISEKYTKPPKKYKFDKVKQNTFPMQDYNFMMDLLELPTTKEGYKYLLVAVDLWSNDFDIEPMKTKTSDECLNAFKVIVKRKYLNLPKGSIRTDNGGEFKGSFHKFLEEHHILHRLSLPYRHKQLANVESLNNQLGRIFMTYLSNKEHKLKKQYLEWIDIVDDVRTELNNARYKLPDEDPFNLNPIPFNMEEPGFEVGDIVHRKLEIPKNIYGNRETTEKFRHGDYRFDTDESLKIIKVLNYPNNNRYILNTLPNVSYAENELIPADNDEEYFAVKQIIGMKVIKGKKYYQVWWKGYLKKESTWELAVDLEEDGLEDYIEEYLDKQKKSNKK